MSKGNKHRARALGLQRPEPFVLSLAKLDRLRELANEEVGWLDEARRASGSARAALDHKHRCEEKRRKLEPALHSARSKVARSRDPDLAERHAEDLATLEAEYQKLVDEIAGTRARQNRLTQKAQAAIAIATPLTQRIDGVCRLLRKTRSELDLDSLGRIA